jgi:putative endonuclease
LKYYVYVIYSDSNKSRYVGISKIPENRLKDHNRGKNKSTKPYKPWRLVYTEEFSSWTEARKREKHLKSGIGREFLDKILNLDP